MYFAIFVIPLLFVQHVYAVVTVFDKGESNYTCIKIPVLLTTAKGSLVAFGEGRIGSCSDYAPTDLVFKRSVDNGDSWSTLGVVFGHQNFTSDVAVFGNAAPVVLPHNNRILLPFCQNNYWFLLTESIDDGITWSKPRNVTELHDANFGWIGTGPPASLFLSSGRIVVPSYRAKFHFADGYGASSMMYYSDDLGVTWNVSSAVGGVLWTSECQAIEIAKNHLILNARCEPWPFRCESESTDGGETWSDAAIVSSQIQPWGGCEGSIVRDVQTGIVYYSSPGSTSYLRFNMTLYSSSDNGISFSFVRQLYAGRSAYSSLTFLTNGSLSILYEISTVPDKIFFPTQFLFDVLN